MQKEDKLLMERLMHKILWLLVAAGLLSGCATPYPEQVRNGSNEEIVGMIRKGDIKYHTGGIIEQVVADRSLVCDWVTQGRREVVETFVRQTPPLRGESVIHRLPLLACITSAEDYDFYKRLGAPTHRYSNHYVYNPPYWLHATPLSEAASNGNALAVSLLIADGVPVDQPGHRRITPLGYVLRTKEMLRSGPQEFRPGYWGAAYFDFFYYADGADMRYGPKTLEELDRVMAILLQSGADPDALTADGQSIGGRAASRPGETLRQRYAKDSSFQQAMGLARELRGDFFRCRDGKFLPACQHVSAQADPLSTIALAAAQRVSELDLEQQEWARLKAAQACRLWRDDWLYLGSACASGLAHGTGQARARDGSRAFEGRFERGQPSQGRLLFRGEPYFEGALKNLTPEGAGICWHQGQPEECRMLNGQRIDALHKQREDNARLQQQAREQERRDEEARMQRQIEETRRRREREAEERRERKNERALAAGIAAMRGGNAGPAASNDGLASSLRMAQQQNQIMAQGMADIQRAQAQREEARREQARREAAQQEAERQARQQAQQRLMAQQNQQAQSLETTRQRQQREAAAERAREDEARRTREEETRRQEEAQAATARREAERQQRERERQAEQQSQARLEADYLKAIKEGTRMKVISCYGDHYVSGERPRVKEPAGMSSCVNVAVTAWCPGDRSGRPVLARNFVGMAGCFGDTYKIEPRPSCKAEDMRVVVESVQSCP
ncbi:MAG: hypothetical protein K2Y15_12725 [Burkholderiaceae bacterium]|nr:hypothetical protein [Burkholderiaceae bacterium]